MKHRLRFIDMDDKLGLEKVSAICRRLQAMLRGMCLECLNLLVFSSLDTKECKW